MTTEERWNNRLDSRPCEWDEVASFIEHEKHLVVEEERERVRGECKGCADFRDFKEWFSKTEQFGGEYAEWVKLKTATTINNTPE